MQVILEVAKTYNKLSEKFDYPLAVPTDLTEEEAAKYVSDYPEYSYFFMVADIAPATINWVDPHISA